MIDINDLFLFIYDISPFYDENFFNEQYELVKEYRRNKIDNLSLKEDKIRSLSAEYVLIKALEYVGLDYFKESIEVDKNGKLFLKSNKIQFNISHSGSKVICGISSYSIGVDIQLKKEVNFDIAKRFFTISENELILKNNSKDMFYKIWTLKESYIKCVGKGLLIPLNSFEISFKNEKPIINQTNSKFEFKLFTHEIEGYQIALCVEQSNIDDNNLKVITL